MVRSGRSSVTSVGHYFRLSSGNASEGPRGNSPPGMKTIPGGAAERKPVTRRLAVDSRNVIRRYVAVRPKRIDIRIGPAGRHVTDLLAPVDPERRVHCGEDVFH